MKSPMDERFIEWREDPEPMRNDCDDVLKLETGSRNESGYWVWKISGNTEEFIVYHGDLMDVEE